MRWVVALLVAFALGGALGCTQPEPEVPFLRLHHNHTLPGGSGDEDPDGGELPLTPVGDPGAAGNPVD